MEPPATMASCRMSLMMGTRIVQALVGLPDLLARMLAGWVGSILARKSASQTYILPKPATIFWLSRWFLMLPFLPLDFVARWLASKSFVSGSGPMCFISS